MSGCLQKRLSIKEDVRTGITFRNSALLFFFTILCDTIVEQASCLPVYPSYRDFLGLSSVGLVGLKT